ncbi:Multidrug resistance protein fnx1 [Cyphellophora attinorum]|uniref:Multidrug resistance protein fnx1 n=1 Tax=Cyphellophora attinorum TaxID=1664694 RepID=A0A0N0NMH2_9EURO|nr:Multidrug resistance protein fnx1 [Phialophora attinorum]KPI40199.1 Multidrug resistance protein fnx1 [Phialophora attinorum]
MAGETQDQPSERSPLLANGHAAEQQARNVDGANETALADTPSTSRLILILGACFVGVFFAALDTTVVATLTAPISSEFESLSLLSWLASGYLIANAACQPLSGKLTDIFSRRTGLIFSNVFFAVGTLICGLAQSAEVVIAGRVIAGIGGGGLTCISTFVTSDLVPLRQRGVWQGVGNLVFGLGMGSGGVFGGFCADKLSWRWAFLIQVPFIVVSTILVWFLVDIPVNPSNKPALRRIDFLGATTLVLSLVLLLIGLNTGGNQLPWSDARIIASLVLAALTLAAFLYIESSPKLVPEPIIPVSLIIRTRTVLAACLCNWFATMATFLFLYYIPLYLENALSMSPTSAGLRVIPIAIGTSAGSLGSGFIMRLTGRYYWLMLGNMLVYITGAALVSTLQLETPRWATFVYVSPLGWGYGSMLTITLVGMISAVEHKHQAVITAASYAFRSTGSTIGITIASAVYQNVLTKELRQRYGGQKGSEEVIRRIRNSLDAINHIPDNWRRSDVLDAYMEALRSAFLVGLGLAVLAALMGLLMKEHKLHANLARKSSNAGGVDGESDGQEENAA